MTSAEAGHADASTARTALNYVRARHVDGEERSDYDRINRQQHVPVLAVARALSSKVLLDPGKLHGFIDAFTQRHLRRQRRHAGPGDARPVAAERGRGRGHLPHRPHRGHQRLGNEIPREDDIEAIFQAIIDDQPLPGEERKEPRPPSALEPRSPPHPRRPRSRPSVRRHVSLQVSNGSGVTGLAATRRRRARRNTGSRSTASATTAAPARTPLVRYSPGLEAEAATVASSTPGAVLQESSDLGGIIEVVLGSNFSGTVAHAQGRSAPR